ncbi:MAG TPA: YkvA family protein [Gemmatimonadaceae bacterium]|nr:YkvA family protein [Gemmatimonadaceae bacterium]
MTPRSATGSSRARRSRVQREVDAETLEVGGRPRTGARRTLLDTIKQIPAYLRLLGGLLTDRRVAGMDKLLVAGAIAYIVMPVDIVPDFIPFVGQVDDIYLLVLALQRLISHAGPRVLHDHWSGTMADLSPSALRNVLLAAAFFLPPRIRRRLRVIGRS